MSHHGEDASPTPSRIDRGTAVVRSIMDQRGMRLTHRREAVVRTALQLPGHFCARTLADHMSASGYQGSLNTVYRMLPLMIDAGVLRETSIASLHGQLFEDIFERATHEHLRCIRCHEIVEFELPALAEEEQRLASRHGFKLLGRAYELQGVCLACRNRKQEA